jgi:hypothetical protein
MRVTFSFANSLSDLERVVGELQQLFESVNRGDHSVVLDFSKSLVFDPAFVVTVANVVQRVTSLGLNCRCEGEDLADQLFASGLCTFFSELDVSGYNAQWLLPVSAFTGAAPTLVDQIVNEVGSLLPSFPDRNERFGQTVAELMENVRVHSGCPWGGFICARVNQTERHVRVALGDFGKGIPGTLSSVPPYNAQLGNDIIVYEAFKYWVTGKPGLRAGSGLAYVADFVRAIGGVIRAYSGLGCVRIDPLNTCLRLATASYPGTVFTIDLPLR